MPNDQNQIMVSFNYDRIRFWIGLGAHITKPVAELLGLAGFLPIYPKTYMDAWRARKKIAESEKTQKKDEVE
jgi:small subunit ribosomal protein S16